MRVIALADSRIRAKTSYPEASARDLSASRNVSEGSSHAPSANKPETPAKKKKVPRRIWRLPLRAGEVTPKIYESVTAIVWCSINAISAHNPSLTMPVELLRICVAQFADPQGAHCGPPLLRTTVTLRQLLEHRLYRIYLTP